MITTTRTAAVTLSLLLLVTATAHAQGRARRGLFTRWANRGVEQVAAAPATPVYHTNPSVHVVYEYQTAYISPMAAEAAPAEVVDAEPPAPAGPPAADPYGFASILNDYRTRVGLPPVAFDANLSAWASQNNAAQCHSGLGHHVNPNCVQNSGWNYSTAWDVFVGWLNSPGHRANLLSPTISRMGIAYGPGPYWTMNAQ